MFLRILTKAIAHRRSRVLVAVGALGVGSAVAAAMLSIYYDASYKMGRELRAYGANVMLAPARPDELIEDAVVDELSRASWPVQIAGAAPFLYLVAQLENSRVMLAGTRFDQARSTNPWWELSGDWPDRSENMSECVVGAELAGNLGLKKGDSVTVSYAPTGRAATLVVTGVLATGGPEDNQILTSLREAQRLGGLEGRVTAVAISAVGEYAQVDRFATEINAGLEGVRASLVRQIAESEGRVLARLRLMMLLITILILGAAALSISTTLTALVLERRPEIGTMKALGAAESKILRLFLCELAALGVAGGVLGYGVGIGLAQPIGRSLFNSGVAPRAGVVLTVIAISIGVALLSGVIPIRKIREVEPAAVLKGE